MSVVISRTGAVKWRGNRVGTVERIELPAGAPLWKFKSVDESGPRDVTMSLRRAIYQHVQRHYVGLENCKR